MPVDVRDRREPAAARRVVEDARIGEPVAVAAEEHREIAGLHELRRAASRPPDALGEVHHLDDEARPCGDGHVGRLEASGDDVVQARDRLRDGDDRPRCAGDRRDERERSGERREPLGSPAWQSLSPQDWRTCVCCSLERHVGGVRLVERMQPVDHRADVRRHARAAREQAVLLARAGPAPRRPPRRVLVAALRRIERIEAVTEDARRVVSDEGVLATPALTVHRVVRVEIDEAAEAVGRRAEARRAEAVDRRARDT